MAKTLHIRPELEERLNMVCNIFDNSATAITNMLIDKGLRIIEERLPEIAKELESNPEIKHVFKQAVKENYQVRRRKK